MGPTQGRRPESPADLEASANIVSASIPTSPIGVDPDGGQSPCPHPLPFPLLPAVLPLLPLPCPLKLWGKRAFGAGAGPVAGAAGRWVASPVILCVLMRLPGAAAVVKSLFELSAPA